MSVRVVGNDDETSDWAEPITLEAALFSPDSWLAELVAHPGPGDLVPVQFIRDFAVRDGLVAARLRTTAHGAYQAEINSAIVSDDVLAPGWTSYDERLLVRTADVTALLRAGANRLAATVAAGWFGESFGFLGHAKHAYAGTLAFLAQLELDYTDGTTDVIATDADWLATGPARSCRVTGGRGIGPSAPDHRSDQLAFCAAGASLVQIDQTD